MSQLVKQLVQASMAERRFAHRTFRSKRDPSVEYVTTIFWGGTMEYPNIHCTCPLATFQRKLCHHGQRMWDELDAFAKQHIVRDDEIVGKPWYRGAK